MKRNLLILSIFTVFLVIISIYLSRVDKGGQFSSFQLSHFEDKTNQATINQLIDKQKQGLFKNINPKEVQLGYTESLHWFYFEINNSIVPANLSLEINNGKINGLELFEIKEGQIRSLGKTGDFLPFQQRPTPTHAFVYPIRLDSYENVQYFLVLDKRYEELTTPIRLWYTSSFEQYDQKEYFLWGLFIGISGLIILINAFFWIISRDKVYFWYILYIFTFGLRQLTDLGFGFQFFWPSYPHFNKPEPLFMVVWLYIFSFITFLFHFVGIDKKQSKAFRWALLFRWVPLILFVMVVVLQVMDVVAVYPKLYAITIRVHATMAIVIILTLFWLLLENRKSKEPIIMYFNFALRIQLVGQIIITIQNLSKNVEGSFQLLESAALLNIIFILNLIVFSLWLVQRYSHSRKQNEALQLELYQTNEVQTQQLIEALQHERKQITEDLHEDVGTTLEAATAQLKTLSKKLPLLNEAKQLIDKAGNDLKMVTNNLIPIDFAQKGLAKSLQDMLKKLDQSSEVKFIYKLNSQPVNLNISIEVQVYRMAAELVKNILKHAQATEAIVQLSYHPKQLELIVQDNGKGFDDKQSSDGIGVRGIYARADYLRAEIQVKSDSTGTKVVVKVPY